MARKKQNEANRWMKAESLKYFQKYFASSMTYDRDMFAVPTAYISKDLWRSCIVDAFSPEELAAAEVVVDCDMVDETLLRLTTRGKTANRGRDLVNAVTSAAVKKYSAAATDDEPFRRRFNELADTLHLNAMERRVLFVCNSGVIDEMFCSTPTSRRSDRRQNRLESIARATGATNSELKNMVRQESKLVRYGCIDNDFDAISSVVDFLEGMVDDAFTSAYYTRYQGETLPLSFYNKKARAAADRINRLVVAAKGKSPVNVLLYGVPGTGKTSLACSIAHELGRECYFIVQADTSRNGYCRTIPAYRYGAVNLAQDRLDPKKSIIVVDEADDLLNNRGDKGMLNSVLDSVKVPVIWISNSQRGQLDESNCRRFDTSLEFRHLKARERLMVWKNCLRKLGVESLFSEEQLIGFAKRYPVSAGDISQVMANVLRQKPRTAKKAAALVEEYMAPHCDLIGIKLEKPNAEKPKPENGATRDYSLEGLNVKGDVKPADIVAAVKKFRAINPKDCPDRPRMTILLSGAPGTGKTEFCRYLAGELDEELVTLMGSDLLDKFVGESEKRIAAAFAQCRPPKKDEEEEEADDLEERKPPKNKILFFDEIDGMVQSRSMARASWEVSKVNEILHQMENFDGVFIGATNFSDHLDEAIMRRFTYKLEFGWLENEGKRLFFEKYFKTPLTDDEKAQLDDIQQLSVADFATVRRKFYFLDRPVTNQERLNALREEVAVKAKEVQGAHIGF